MVVELDGRVQVDRAQVLPAGHLRDLRGAGVDGDDGQTVHAVAARYAERETLRGLRVADALALEGQDDAEEVSRLCDGEPRAKLRVKLRRGLRARAEDEDERDGDERVDEPLPLHGSP